jgi:hypothetical protein
VIRATKVTAVRYEHPYPGSVGPYGRREAGPDPRWRRLARRGDAHDGKSAAPQRIKVGFDYVHSLVDDHFRLAYSRFCPVRRARPAQRFWNVR